MKLNYILFASRRPPAGAQSQDESCGMGEKTTAEAAVQPNRQINLQVL